MTDENQPSLLTRVTIALILLVQMALGIIFVAAPHAFADALHLAPAPGWTDWIFAQFGARALGFAFGMGLVLRAPRDNAGWIRAMIVVQIVDWIGTAMALAAGKIGLAQAMTAPFLPVLFVVVLALELRRQSRGPTSRSKTV